MRFISWNIDSLNAALTSDSARAILTRGVLTSIAASEADIIAIQETKLPTPEKAMPARWPSTERGWKSERTIRKSVLPSRWTVRAA